MTVQNSTHHADDPATAPRPGLQTGPEPAAPEITLSVTEARGGQRVGLVKILLISTGLAVLAMTAFWVIALRQHGAIHPGSGLASVSESASERSVAPVAAPVVPATR
jgi:hypothetical protein